MKSILLSIVSILIFILGFSGCSTKYQPQSISGGYSETRLGDNVFSVSFRGNGYTSREKTTDFVLLRSSELTLENNFKYFTIINSEKYTNTYTTPSSYTTTGTINGSSYYGHTTQTGGMTFVKPSSNNTIMCFTEKPNIDGIVYNPEYLIKSIKQKYNIE
jgi:hypothetical protein